MPGVHHGSDTDPWLMTKERLRSPPRNRSHVTTNLFLQYKKLSFKRGKPVDTTCCKKLLPPGHFLIEDSLLHEHLDIPVVKVIILVFESGIGGRGIK